MATFEYSVDGQSIVTTKAGRLVSGTIGVNTVKFTFDSSWSGLEKWATFDPNPGKPYKQPLDANGECLIPGEVMGGITLRIGAFGLADGQAYPTVWANKLTMEEGCFIEVPVSDWPEPAPIIEEILEELENKVDKPENATVGNVAVIGSNNNIADSGVSKDNLILAPQLASNNFKSDSVPYVYRQTGGGIGTGNREYDSIVGGSIVYKQMLNGRTTAITTNDITVTPNADGSVTVSGTASANTNINFDISNLKFEANHVYYCQAKGVAYTYYCQVSGSSGGGIYGIALTESSILKATQTKSEHYRLYVYNEQAVNFTFTPLVLDLTAMFGSAVADRIFTLYGGANTGTAEPFMASLGLTTYRSYTATPSLESVSGLQKHRTVGFNLFDKSKITASSRMRTDGTIIDNSYSFVSDYISVIPNTEYFVQHIIGTSSSTAGYAEYDDNKNLLAVYSAGSGGGVNVGGKEFSFTTTSGCKFIRFNGVMGYEDATCINISDPARNGTYEPYTEYTYPLDSSLTLRGVAVLDDNGNVKFDGDTYAPDGTVTRRYGIITLDGTQTPTAYNWRASETSVGFGFSYSLTKNKLPEADNKLVRAISTYGQNSSYNNLYNKVVDDGFGFYKTNAYGLFFRVSDITLTTADAVKAYLQAHPITVMYELETPTTETAEPYDALQICDPLGTEEYVTTGICPVGHSTRYPTNQVEKLDGLPSDFSTLIAPTEVTYKATRAYTTGRLLIVNNVLYKATTSIASGATLTVGTNITATTLDEVIASL